MPLTEQKAEDMVPDSLKDIFIPAGNYFTITRTAGTAVLRFDDTMGISITREFDSQINNGIDGAVPS